MQFPNFISDKIISSKIVEPYLLFLVLFKKDRVKHKCLKLQCVGNTTKKSLIWNNRNSIKLPTWPSFKGLHSICQQIWKIQQWPENWKRSVFTPILKKGSAKECSNYQTIALTSHGSNVCSKPFKLGFSSTWELPEVLKKQRNQRSSCQHLLDHRESNGIPEKHLLLFY